MNRKAREILGEAATALGVVAAVAVAALWMTEPLASYFGQGIPYQRNPIAGYELFPLITGDHLQFYYWLWVLADNVLGPSAMFTNPYEFNTFLSAGVPNYANFPWSAWFLAFYGLGPVKAYNLQLWMSYVLAGLCSYALARQVLGSRLAAIPAALVLAFLPLRQSLTLGGHLYGFVVFLFPLCLWCLERGWARRSWRWGAGAGLCLAAMGWMEPHIIYYTALFLGAYVPLRLILMGGGEDAAQADGMPGQALWPLLAGLGLGSAAHLALVRRGAAQLWSSGWLEGLAIYALIALAMWLLLAALLAALSSAGRGQARAVVGRALAPLALSPLYGLQLWLGLPYVGSGLMLLLALAGLVILVRGLRGLAWRWRWPAGGLAVLWPLALGMGLAVAKMLHLKATTFDTSVVAGGRGLPEVAAFSPRLADLFAPDGDLVIKLVYPGAVLTLLALAGLVMLCLDRPRGLAKQGRAALWAVTSLGALLLCVGPSLQAAPLYELMYKYVPFFNFPRMSGRWIVMAVVMMSLLGGWSLLALLKNGKARRAGAVLALVLCGLMLWDFWPSRSPGICLIPPAGPVEATVRDEIKPGPDGGHRLLGLPIWPGDSHQSSMYELMITRTGARMVNGYSPVVPKAYVDKVFWPLYPLDLGEVTGAALDTLRRLEVNLVVFYDDEQVYPQKVSPFPPSLARRRLLASGAFTPVVQHGNAFLYRFNPGAQADPRPGAVTSPVTNLWEAAWLRPRVGRLVEDRAASGWGLLFEGSMDPAAPLGPRLAGAKGNVAQARAGADQPGWLSSGPGKYYPAGRYVARFRLRAGAGGSPGRVEVAYGKEPRVLAALELGPAVLPADGAWHEVAVPFELPTVGPIYLRTWFSGAADLALDAVLVNFSGREQPEKFYAAQQLWRQVGGLVADARVPGGLAVTAQKDHTPPIYLMHGPQVSLNPGRYLARFRLAAGPGAKPAGERPAADLAVAGDLGRITLGHRRVNAGQLGSGYRDFAVEFTVPRRMEIGLRVRYLGGADLRLAGVELAPRP